MRQHWIKIKTLKGCQLFDCSQQKNASRNNLHFLNIDNQLTDNKGLSMGIFFLEGDKIIQPTCHIPNNVGEIPFSFFLFTNKDISSSAVLAWSADLVLYSESLWNSWLF